jgi:hypothetical protein
VGDLESVGRWGALDLGWLGTICRQNCVYYNYALIVNIVIYVILWIKPRRLQGIYTVFYCTIVDRWVPCPLSLL